LASSRVLNGIMYSQTPAEW